MYYVYITIYYYYYYKRCPPVQKALKCMFDEGFRLDIYMPT